MRKQLTDRIENIERTVSEFKIKPDRKGHHKVQFVKGSVDGGFRTALHFDCDYVLEKKKDEGKGNKLIHYPKLFKMIMEQPGVKHIKVRWYWSKDEPKTDDQKLTITDFLKKNDESELSSETAYKILQDSYY